MKKCVDLRGIGNVISSLKWNITALYCSTPHVSVDSKVIFCRLVISLALQSPVPAKQVIKSVTEMETIRRTGIVRLD